MQSNGKEIEVDMLNLFDDFYEHYSSVSSELACKEEILKLNVSQNNKLSEMNNKLREEYSTLQATVNECQAQLHIVCDLQDEIRLLKKEVVDKEEALQKEIKQWKKSFEELQKDMTSRLEEQKLSMTNSHQTEVDKLRETIRSLEDDKASLDLQLENLNKEKTAEINSLMMNYQSKLSKASRQNAQYKQQQQLVVNQDALRKKMQHMKTGYENETTSLKARISDLEQANEKLGQRLEKQSCVVNPAALPPCQGKPLSVRRKSLKGNNWSLSLHK